MERVKTTIDPALRRIGTFLSDFENKLDDVKASDEKARNRLIEIETETAKISSRGELAKKLSLLYSARFFAPGCAFQTCARNSLPFTIAKHH